MTRLLQLGLRMKAQLGPRMPVIGSPFLPNTTVKRVSTDYDLGSEEGKKKAEAAGVRRPLLPGSARN